MRVIVAVVMAVIRQFACRVWAGFQIGFNLACFAAVVAAIWAILPAPVDPDADLAVPPVHSAHCGQCRNQRLWDAMAVHALDYDGRFYPDQEINGAVALIRGVPLARTVPWPTID